MEIKVLKQPADSPAWDEFLAAQPTGHHLQCCAWGRLKAAFGWRVIRIVAQEGAEILGGAQILTRRLPVWGRIGYISKGPVVAPGRADVMEALFDHIEQAAQAERILVLSVQPPEDAPLYMRPLTERQFRPSSFYVVPPATVLVDLRPDEDDILLQMKSKTRYNIRLATRKGVVVREGGEADLETFYRLTEVTGERSDVYVYYDLDYYREAWRQFAPHGMIKLFTAYYQDEPLACLIAIAFGQWSVYKWGASSDQHREVMPNNLLQWEAIRWSKARGCRYYDLGGITPVVAEAIERGENLHAFDHPSAGVARFKLGFGELFAFPGSYDNNYGFRPRWLIRQAVALAWKFPLARGLARGARSAG